MNLRRIIALTAKERKQMLREPSNIAVGILLPIMMLLIFGYGMTMDIRNIDLAIVHHGQSPAVSNVIAHFNNSKYFSVDVYHSTLEAEEAIRSHHADAALFLPDDFEAHLLKGDAPVQIVSNATNASIARIYENSIRTVFMQAAAAALPQSGTTSNAGVRVINRLWFNEKNDSRCFMVPGVIVLIMSLIGCMLTALQMAKEYEHGNMESMFVTPMTSGEILIAKMINNYILGMIGLGISLIAARWLFDVPFRGSLLILLIGASMFLILQMSVGLVISSVTKSQFISCQLSLFISFLPVMMLSGFLWEIPNMPDAVQYFTYLVPGRYFVDFMQSIMLVGNVWSNILTNMAGMVIFTLILLILAKLKNPKRLTGGGI